MKRVKVQVQLRLDDDESQLSSKAALQLGLPVDAVNGMVIERRSVDARKNDVKLLYALSVGVPDDVRLPQGVLSAPETPEIVPLIGDKRLSSRPVVVGGGPCGLFAALLLAEQGYKPVVLERGCDVEGRTAQVGDFFAGAGHDPENNVLFGDGGAGAFSDGKLTARSRDEFGDKVLRTLVDHGAPKDILYDAKPHVGTDVFSGVIQSLKRHILDLGASWYNGAKVVGLTKTSGKLSGFVYEQGGERIQIPCECAVLAIGHSARDTYEMLQKEDVALAFKPFAVGVRIEHPQSLIDTVQYGIHTGHPKLGHADYRLTANVNGRGVYTFCMCPGGMVIPSVSEEGCLCVNGMSYHSRDLANANAAIVVQVNQSDCGGDALSGVAFQRRFEQQAYRLGGSTYAAPAQTLAGFLQKKAGPMGSVKPSYPRGVTSANLWDCLPPFAASGIAQGCAQFDGRLRGFAYPDAVLTGVEMRTSSPVRILRNEKGQSESLLGLYPAGEGAGYAGGIVSAAADGIKAALDVMREYTPL